MSETPLTESVNGSEVQVAPKQRKRIGRPPKIKNWRTESVILGRLAQGRSIRSICKAKYLPNFSTVFDWIQSDPDFAKRYARARSEQADILAEEIVEIGDSAKTGEEAQVARVRIDARKWFAAKVAPSKYGEKQGDIHVNQAVNNFTVITQDKARELQERRKALLTEGNG